MTPGLTRRAVAAAASIGPALLAARAAAAAPAIPVVATFSILGDLVRAVGGDRVAVAALIGPDRDAHGFEPLPADAAEVAAARLLVANGLGFDNWIDRLARAGGSAAPVLVASRAVTPRPGGRRGIDPHAFGSVRNAGLYVEAIGEGLVAVDPAGADAYRAGAAAYRDALGVLDAEVRAGIGRIPPERRKVVTSHDAFGYFGAEYGLAFIAPRGVSGEADVSAREIAAIIRQVRADRIPAIFLENVADPRLLQEIARETGARIGGRLYSDALSGPGGPAATYLDLVRSNLGTLVAALVP